MSESQLPPTPSLSKADQRVCNRMADQMNAFHEHFRHQWNGIYSSVYDDSSSNQGAAQNTATTPTNPSKQQTYPPPDTSQTPLPSAALLRAIQQFVSNLSVHHSIEEQYIFPVLAKRMPEFQDTDKNSGPYSDHRVIHKGLDELEAYVSDVRSGERSLRRDEVRKILESFGSTLWRHLDEEVEILGWRNMSRYWTREEILGMPM